MPPFVVVREARQAAPYSGSQASDRISPLRLSQLRLSISSASLSRLSQLRGPAEDNCRTDVSTKHVAYDELLHTSGGKVNHPSQPYEPIPNIPSRPPSRPPMSEVKTNHQHIATWIAINLYRASDLQRPA